MYLNPYLGDTPHFLIFYNVNKKVPSNFQIMHKNLYVKNDKMKSLVCQYNYYYFDRKTQNEGGVSTHVITYFFTIHDLL